MWRALGISLVLLVIGTGCVSPADVGETRAGTPASPTPGPSPAPTPAPTPAPNSGPATGGTAGAIIARDCRWCHTLQHPAAGIEFESGRLTRTQLDAMGRGVQLELAPFITRLARGDKQTLLDWVRAQGGHVPVASIPSRATWRLADAIARLPDGAPAPGFAFVIEDGYIDTQGWTVQRYTDRHGVTHRGVQLAQTHGVDRSVFTSSRNPSSYLLFNDIPWHGRFTDCRLEGDVRVGRWMSVGMHARELQPTGRSHRQYVRLQFDRDAISLRSAPTPLETWPWGNRPDPHLTGTTDASGFYQTSSEWLHFVFAARRTSNGVQWTARVTNPATGAVMANLSALEVSADPLAGTFFLHSYSTGGNRMWANLVLDAAIDSGN